MLTGQKRPREATEGHAMPPPPAFAPPQTCFFPPDDRRGLVCLGVTRARAAPLPLHSLGRPNICSVQWLVMEKESRGGSREGRKGPRWIHRSTEHQNNQQDDQERSERMGRMGRKFGIARCVENAALESFVDSRGRGRWVYRNCEHVCRSAEKEGAVVWVNKPFI